MAWRLWSRFCCSQHGVLLLVPLLLLFITVFLKSVTVTRLTPSSKVNRPSSRVLSSAENFRSGFKVVLSPTAPAFQKDLQQLRSRTRTTGPEKRTHLSLPKQLRASEERQQMSSRQDKTKLSEFVHDHAEQRSRPEERTQQAFTETVGAGREENHRTADRKEQERRPRGKVGEVHHSGRKRKSSRDPQRRGDRAKLHWRGAGGIVGRQRSEVVAEKERQAACPSFREQELLEWEQKKVRVRAAEGRPPWLSEDDVQKMQLLAEGEVMSKARVPAHGQVLQVGLRPHGHGQGSTVGDELSHRERCARGLCSLLKRSEDWFEVFAFHLDRVLGLNRTLPAVLRTFHSQILPYRYSGSRPRPAVWWDPHIQHLTDKDRDQDSVRLDWVQYQELLQARCGRDTELWSPPCVGVGHSEWGGLALFDFLLQVNDRLDRNCCGFTPEPTEPCVENLLQSRCGSSKDLQLVHILVRVADPSRLVFIDNAGRPHQSKHNLNFRLLEGIEEFPEKAVSVLRSGCLGSLLLRSLHTDQEFWDSQGGGRGLQPLIREVEHRAHVLLQHIHHKQLQSDL